MFVNFIQANINLFRPHSMIKCQRDSSVGEWNGYNRFSVVGGYMLGSLALWIWMDGL